MTMSKKPNDLLFTVHICAFAPSANKRGFIVLDQKQKGIKTIFPPQALLNSFRTKHSWKKKKNLG